MACIDAIGSTAETSTRPASVSSTMTLHGSMVPILLSSCTLLLLMVWLGGVVLLVLQVLLELHVFI